MQRTKFLLRVMLILALCRYAAAQAEYVAIIGRMEKFYRDNLNCSHACNSGVMKCLRDSDPVGCNCRAIETLLNFHEQYLALEFAACELKKTKLMIKDMEDMIRGLHELMSSDYFSCYNREKIRSGVAMLERALENEST